jgi:hypothetical protein
MSINSDRATELYIAILGGLDKSAMDLTDEEAASWDKLVTQIRDESASEEVKELRVPGEWGTEDLAMSIRSKQPDGVALRRLGQGIRRDHAGKQ